jgi:hypothetical protein
MHVDIIKNRQIIRIKVKAGKVFNEHINEYWYSSKRLMKHNKKNLDKLEAWMDKELGYKKDYAKVG